MAEEVAEMKDADEIGAETPERRLTLSDVLGV
ncbi:hypothetical protein PI125_g17216 [Phytophthora idaei]|nr:hypothetical protein PI125_g17216 [Phytophthora idaei]KAG3150857.1 hypothetical protein PI126_g11283 [Phytophthora idaei]